MDENRSLDNVETSKQSLSQIYIESGFQDLFDD